MTKFWDVGQVKTRLGASIGMEQAADLHRLFVSHLCKTLADVADQRIACLSPDPSDGRFNLELRSWGLERHWKAMPQGDGCLGKRMERWFIHFLGDQVSTYCSGSSPSTGAILIGGDCPLIGPNDVRHAAVLLARRDVVIGPAADGGYYLIGIRGPWATRRARLETLFRDIPWSTPQVMRITRERVKSAGLSLAELEIREDVDTVVELNRLRAFLSANQDGKTGLTNRLPNLDDLKAGIDRIMAGESVGGERTDHRLLDRGPT